MICSRTKFAIALRKVFGLRPAASTKEQANKQSKTTSKRKQHYKTAPCGVLDLGPFLAISYLATWIVDLSFVRIFDPLGRPGLEKIFILTKRYSS